MIIQNYIRFIGGIILIVLGAFYGGKIHDFTLESSCLLIYLALLSSIAFSLCSVLLKDNKVGLMSVYNFLTPIFGSILSAIFLGETTLELKNIIALVLVCIGIWRVNKA